MGNRMPHCSTEKGADTGQKQRFGLGGTPQPACYKPRREKQTDTPRKTCATTPARHSGANEKRFLHHHVGAVLQLAGRQRALRRCRRTAPHLGFRRVATRGTGADVRAVLRHPGAAGRRLRRCGAQGQGDVLRQPHQGGGLPDDAVRRASAAVVRDRRAGCRRLLAGEVRHPDRAAAEFAAGQGKRLDRGADDRLDHPRRAARRATRRAHGFQPAPGDRLSADRHRASTRRPKPPSLR